MGGEEEVQGVYCREQTTKGGGKSKKKERSKLDVKTISAKESIQRWGPHNPGGVLAEGG